MKRLLWCVFVAILLVMAALPLLRHAHAQPASSPLCVNGMCVVPEDELRATFRYIEYLENQLGKTCL